VRGVKLFMILAVLAALLLPASAAAASLPGGFVGMNADGPLFGDQVNLSHQLAKMSSSGVERLRVLFDWANAQPYANWNQADSSGQSQDYRNAPNGVPTDYRATDQIVELAAENNLPVLPVIKYAPSWDASSHGNHTRPARNGPFGNYMTALVDRYGPHGSFWAANPSLPYTPITSWQVWNEPDISWGKYWPSQYVALLRVAHRDIKQADPRAITVLASLSNYSWEDLASIYKVHGARKLFDVVTINAYTAHPSGVITILHRARAVMKRNGDAQKPMLATEVGWPAALGKTSVNPGFDTTQQGQATKLKRLLPLLASNRQQLGLEGFYYYTWMTTDQGSPPFNYSGLLRIDPSSGQITAKPAYWAFRHAVRALEG
jgi:hypothetical protein